MKQKIIDFIHEYYALHNTTPRLKDFVKKNGYPCNTETVCKLFGKYNDLIRECGYETYQYGQRHYNKQELLNDLKQAILQHRSIDFNFIRKDNNLKHRDVYTNVFGNVRNAVNKAGITNNKIYLLKCYPDYNLENPKDFLINKLGLKLDDVHYELINELNKLKENGESLLRDNIAKLMSISKIYRYFYSYNNFIIISGNEVNLKNKNYILAKDNHMCDSYEEKIVDDWLSELEVQHEVHKRYPNSKLICDFKLDGCYIECIGYSRNKTSKQHEKYIEHLKIKEEICNNNNVKLITIENVKNINRKDFAEALHSNVYRITL